MSADVVVTAEELEHRTVLRKDLKEDRAAFLDTRIPGSEKKVNYPLIGAGVSENAEQVIPVTEPHGFNLGAAVMPEGVINNLHLHFTAEVFMCLAGEWQFRWGVDGADGEAVVSAGDVISIPTWIFRGFTSKTDDAWLYTALGRDEAGGLIWAPSVIEKAAATGKFQSVAGPVIELEPGQTPDDDVELVTPLTQEQLDSLRKVDVQEMRGRLAKPEDLVWNDHAFLDSDLPGGGAQLALVVGYGLTQDGRQHPRLAEPHGLSLAWLRAQPGQGVNAHRIPQAQAVIVKEGRVRVTLNKSNPVSVELGEYDTLSIPKGAWRTFEGIGDDTTQFVVLTEGDDRAYPEFDQDLVAQAYDRGALIDPNGHLAQVAMMPR